MALRSINPATGETLATFDTLTPAEVERQLAARDARRFESWKHTPFAERARLPDARGRHPRRESPSSSGA